MQWRWRESLTAHFALQITTGVCLLFYLCRSQVTRCDLSSGVSSWCVITFRQCCDIMTTMWQFDRFRSAYVTLVVSCWCRTPSPCWRNVNVMVSRKWAPLRKTQLLAIWYCCYLSKLVRTPAPATPLTMFTPAPLRIIFVNFCWMSIMFLLNSSRSIHCNWYLRF